MGSGVIANWRESGKFFMRLFMGIIKWIVALIGIITDKKFIDWH
jgi:hypothetical protein